MQQFLQSQDTELTTHYHHSPLITHSQLTTCIFSRFPSISNHPLAPSLHRPIVLSFFRAVVLSCPRPSTAENDETRQGMSLLTSRLLLAFFVFYPDNYPVKGLHVALHEMFVP